MEDKRGFRAVTNVSHRLPLIIQELAKPCKIYTPTVALLPENYIVSQLIRLHFFNMHTYTFLIASGLLAGDMAMGG